MTTSELSAGYIDPEHTGRDRELLETFYAAARSEGGTADEVTLRGLQTILARFSPLPPQPSDCPACEGQPASGNSPCAICGAKGPTSPPEPGEVQELVSSLRSQRANYLEKLQRLSPPQPVPVSERLPGPEDCDAEGLCWCWHFVAHTWGMFRLDLSAHSYWLPVDALPDPWRLPAHALPLPGEVEG